MKILRMPYDELDCWPEIFNDIKIKIIPVKYLSEVSILFANNKVWKIELYEHLTVEQQNQFEKQLKQMLKVYSDNIVKINYKINVKKVKKDITSKTKKFFRKTR